MAKNEDSFGIEIPKVKNAQEIANINANLRSGSTNVI